MRIRVLWTRPSGYIAACLRALSHRPEVSEVHATFRPPTAAAAFDVADLDFGGTEVHLAPPGTRLRHVDADVILAASWGDAQYRAVLRSASKVTLRIMTMDNVWRGSAKQGLAVAAGRFVLPKLCDVLLVAGERQRAYAIALGFKPNSIVNGLYAADIDTTAAPPARRPSDPLVYVGRMAPEKGVATLLAAYALYSANHPAPRPLHLIGGGGLPPPLLPGVRLHGFVQPHLLRRHVNQGAALVLPSRYEPWGLVVQEGAALGLALLLSSAVGCASSYLQHGVNGYMHTQGNARQLANHMADIDGELFDWRRSTQVSTSLAGRFTPEDWARNIVHISSGC